MDLGTRQRAMNDDRQHALAAHLQLRVGSGLLLILTALSLGAAWFLRADGHVLEAAFGWRIAFFALLSAIVLNAPLARPLWTGGVHFSAGVRRSVPFAPGEFRGRGPLRPQVVRSGLTGRAALVGAALIALGVTLWLGGLAFSPVPTTGTVSLRLGQRTSDVRPVGLRTGRLAYAHALPHEHTFLGITEDGSGAFFRALDPRSGESGEYLLGRGQPVMLGPHRLSLAAVASGPPVSGLRVRVSGEAMDERVVTLRANVPVPVGTSTLELIDMSEAYLDSPLRAARVRVEGPGGRREVWLIPDDPGIDATHGGSDGVVLTPESFVGTDWAQIRFTARWVWWWRLGVLALVGLGAFLLLLVPHRSWVWTGRPGDLELRLWSLNASSGLRAWSAWALQEALGPEAWTELVAIDAELARDREES